MSYNPDVLEWLALDAFMVFGLLSWVSLIAVATGSDWKAWWETRALKKPLMMGHPMLYSMLFFVIASAASIAAWLNWREGYRSLNLPPNPSSGNEPNNGAFFWANLLFLLYWIFGLSTGPSFFVMGLQYKSILTAAALSFVMLLLSTGLVIVSFYIWLAPGFIFIAVWLFWLYSLIMSLVYSRDFDGNNNHNPFENLVFAFFGNNQLSAPFVPQQATPGYPGQPYPQSYPQPYPGQPFVQPPFPPQQYPEQVNSSAQWRNGKKN